MFRLFITDNIYDDTDADAADGDDCGEYCGAGEWWYCGNVVLWNCGIVELVIRGQWRVLPIHPLLYELPKTLHTSFSRMSRVGTSAKLNKELIWVLINFTTMK